MDDEFMKDFNCEFIQSMMSPINDININSSFSNYNSEEDFFPNCYNNFLSSDAYNNIDVLKSTPHNEIDLNETMKKFPEESFFLNLNGLKTEKKEFLEIPILINKTTAEETAQKNLFPQIKENEIGQKTKKRGRKHKNFDYINLDKSEYHTKYEFLNIFTKMKVHCVEQIKIYFNKKLKESKNHILNSQKFFSIDTSIIKVDKINENKELFKKKLKILFSTVSKKVKNREHNAKTIDTIIKQNDPFFNSLLETEFIEALDIFLEQIFNSLFNGLKTISEDFGSFEKDYIDTCKNFAKDYKEILNGKPPRDKRVKKSKK